MSDRSKPPQETAGTTSHDGDHGGDVAYRRAWWSLALYPLSFVAAFVVGEGLYSWLGGEDDAAAWAVVVAGAPALIVFALPGFAAVMLGR
ncbi:MAG: hypothetical protein WBM50_17490, partial [Acidimicrobiales bacterium]